MIIPNNSVNGRGGFSVRNNRLDDSTYRPVEEIPHDQMTDFIPPSPAPAPTRVAPVPGTSNIPTASGMAAAEGLNFNDLPRPESAMNPLPAMGGSSVLPESVLPEAPQIRVPANPLLPPQYQEVINYENLQYMIGFLRTQIGKYIRAEQLIGSSDIENRYGYLVGVGINYILLQEVNTKNIMALDFYNIKFVYIYYALPSIPTNSTTV